MAAESVFKINGKVTVRKVIGLIMKLLILSIMFLPCAVLICISEVAPPILDRVGAFIDYLVAKIEKFDGTTEEAEAARMWDRLAQK